MFEYQGQQFTLEQILAKANEANLTLSELLQKNPELKRIDVAEPKFDKFTFEKEIETANDQLNASFKKQKASALKFPAYFNQLRYLIAKPFLGLTNEGKKFKESLKAMSPAEEDETIQKIFSAIPGVNIGAGALEFRKRADKLNQEAEELELSFQNYERSIGEALSEGDIAEGATRLLTSAYATLPSLAQAFTPIIGLPSIFATSAADASDRYIREEGGRSGTLKQFAYSTAYGTSEAVFEIATKRLGAGLFKSLVGKSKGFAEKTLKQHFTGIAKGFGIEGGSELGTEFFNRLADQVILGKEDAFNNFYRDGVDVFLVGGVVGMKIQGARSSFDLARRGAVNRSVKKTLDETNINSVNEGFINNEVNDDNIKIARNKNAEFILEAELNRKVESGDLTLQESNNIKNNFKNIQNAVNIADDVKIGDNLINETVSLIQERNAVSNTIKKAGENKSLVNTDIERLLEIDNRLSEISTENRLNITSKKVTDIVGNIEKINIEIANSQQEADKIAKDKNLDKKASSNQGFILQNNETGEQTIVINKAVAKDDQAVNVAAHELLHGVLFKTISENSNAAINLSNALKTEINKIDSSILKDSNLKNRLDQYKENPEAVQAEETLTLFADAMANGDIKFNENIFTKIGDIIRRILQQAGLVDIKFNNSRDVFNFLKDYNKSIVKGQLTKAQQKVVEEGAKGKLITGENQQDNVIVKESKIASDNVQNIYNEKGVDGSFEIIEQFNPIINKLVERRREAPGFNKQDLTDAIKYDERGILGLIRSYKPDSKVPLAAYINKFLPSRMIEASNKILGEEFTLDVADAKGVVTQETEVKISEPVSKKIKPSDLLKSKEKAINTIKEEVIKIKPENLTFKKLKDLSPETTSEIFEVPVKKVTDPKANLNKGDLSNAARNINKNVDKILKLLPKGAVTEAASEKLLGTSTGVPKSLLDVFYTKQERLTKGAGLSPYKLNTINRQQFLNELGIVDGKLKPGLSPRSTEAQRIKSIMSLTGKLITNEIVRSETNLPLNIKQDIAAGKANIMFSKKAQQLVDGKLIELDSGKSTNQLLKFYGQSSMPTLKKIEDIPIIVEGIKNNILKLGPKDMWFGKPDKNGNFGTAFTTSYKLFGFSSQKPADMKLWREYEKQIKELRNLNDSEFGEPIKNIKDYSKISYSTIFKDEATIQKNIENGKIDEFNKKNMAIHKELWLRINKAIRKNNATAPIFGLYLKSVGVNVNHWHKLGAEFVGYSLNAKKFEYEHAMPATQAYIYLLDASLGNKNFNDAYQGVIDNYKLIALDKKADKKVTSAGLQRKMPKGWQFGKNFWFERYFNNAVFKAGGIDPNSIIHTDGSSFANKYNVLSNGINPKILEYNNLKKTDEINKEYSNIKYSLKDLNKEFNEFLEKSTGIGAEKIFSEAKATARGKRAGKTFGDYFVPTGAEDFAGLLHKTLAKGKIGEQQLEFYKENLYNPFNAANESITRERRALLEDFRALKNKLTNVPKKLKNLTTGGDFTISNAVRVYIWNKQGMKIPGLSDTDLKSLIEEVQNDSELLDFSNQLIAITKNDGYAKPENNWLGGNIATDLMSLFNTAKRAKHLETWQNNVDQIFNKENLNKLEAAYGKNYRITLEKTLQRMKSGMNRKWGGDKAIEAYLDWVNGSVGAIMFLNTRSAVLQTISSINYMNFSDNNPLQAAKAFANQPQFWKDFNTIFNSDYLQERRGGNQINVNENELAKAAEKGGIQGVISLLLNKGFIFTKIADSFAIAAGGSAMYRNRIKTYTKEGLSEKEAEAKAFLDFKAITEETQQSSRPDRISEQQASNAGRLLLAFANTPMQYNRIIKRNAQDLVDGRGDPREKIAKIIYYSTIQNIIFNALQKAVFALAFSEDNEDEEEIKKYSDVANGMVDSLLRGSGLTGNAVAAIKNVAIDVAKRSEKPRPNFQDAAWKALTVSPPLHNKATKLRGAGYDLGKVNKENLLDPSLDNPALSAGANIISATTNVPLDRAIRKAQNIEAATRDEAEWWQKMALLLGWGSWEIGLGEDVQKEDLSTKEKIRLRIQKKIDKIKNK